MHLFYPHIWVRFPKRTHRIFPDFFAVTTVCSGSCIKKSVAIRWVRFAETHVFADPGYSPLQPRSVSAVPSAASRLVAAALPAPKAFGVNRRAASELQGLPRLRDRGKRSACRCIGVVLRSHATDYTIIGIRFPEESWGASKLEPTNVVPMAASTWDKVRIASVLAWE